MIHPPQFYLAGIQFCMLDEWKPIFQLSNYLPFKKISLEFFLGK
jgi:hypothetical protein